MADVKESAMSTASDYKWVRALDANGNSIRISKEDHASVVGGLIPEATASSKGLMPAKEAKKSNKVNNMQVGAIHDTGIRDGLIVIGSGATTSSAVFVFGHNKTDATALVETPSFSESSIQVYKSEAGGNILIKNNTASLINIWYDIVSGF